MFPIQCTEPEWISLDDMHIGGIDQKVEVVMGEWQEGQDEKDVGGGEEGVLGSEDVSEGWGKKDEAVEGVQLDRHDDSQDEDACDGSNGVFHEPLLPFPCSDRVPIFGSRSSCRSGHFSYYDFPFFMHSCDWFTSPAMHESMTE